MAMNKKNSEPETKMVLVAGVSAGVIPAAEPNSLIEVSTGSSGQVDEEAGATKPASFKKGTMYSVRVSRPIQMGPFKYFPRTPFEAKGDFINQMIEEHGADAIGNAEPV